MRENGMYISHMFTYIKHNNNNIQQYYSVDLHVSPIKGSGYVRW